MLLPGEQVLPYRRRLFVVWIGQKIAFVRAVEMRIPLSGAQRENQTRKQQLRPRYPVADLRIPVTAQWLQAATEARNLFAQTWDRPGPWLLASSQ